MMFEMTLARMSNAPVLVSSDGESRFIAGISHLAETWAGFSDEQRMELDASNEGDTPRPSMNAVDNEDGFWPEEDSWLARYRPYNVIEGILVIPVYGSLVNHFGFVFGRWVTGYNYIHRAVSRGIMDDEVTGILFLSDSPGGEVSGNFDLADHIAEQREVKPMMTVAADFAFSGAYSIAAASGTIHVTRTGGVGSIGVVTMHLDMSEYLKKMGLAVTFVHAGKHKVDGNQYEPLSPEVKKRIQTRIDGLYSLFVSSVARNLGMDEQAIRDTEALTYSAEEAVDVGLAHAISSYEDSLSNFAGKLATTDGAFQMGTQANSESMAEADATQRKVAEARQTGLEQGRTEGKTEGMDEGRKAERERISGILSCEAAEKRPKQAMGFAMKTEMSVDDAKALLEDMPEESANGGKSHFDSAMGANNPGIEADDTEGGEGGEGAESNDILRDYRAATGERPAAAQ